MPLRTLLIAALGFALAGCGPAPAPTGAIVVPPPPSAAAEPSPLAQPRINVNHVHAIAARDGAKSVLLGTHVGVRQASPGGGGPIPVGEAGLKGDVLALFYSGGLLYAGGHNLGVKASHDDGATWMDVSADLAGADVHGLAADPSQPGRLYAYAVGRGLMVSEDSGAHWNHRAGEADSNYVTGLTVTADGTLLVGTPGRGVAASTDHGASYIVVRTGTGPVYAIASAPTDPGVVLVAAEKGIFLTGDGGKTWNAGGTNVAVTGLAIDAADSHHFYAGAADGTVAVSTDAGITWKAY
ncbi:MAG: hypothetical protein NVSMB17_12950 [Candidatus Dormibacteria bacterium]